MKRMFASIVLLPIQFALADQPVLPNAATADPTHYTVEFENDVLRIVRIKYGPGESSTMHSHDASCGIYLASGAMRMERPDGTSRAAPVYAPGTVHCNDAEIHLPKNVGETAVELVLIEMKGRKTAK